MSPWSASRKSVPMLGAYALTVLSGCITPTAAWKGPVEWPNDYSGKNIVPFTEAGAALAAAGAIREMVRQNLATDPGLFWGCTSPEQGLDVAVFTGPTPGLYYVLVDQRFDRCGGSRGRVLDGWYEYAVTPQGEVVAEASPRAAEEDSAPVAPPNTPPPTEALPTPITPPSAPDAEDPAQLTPPPPASAPTAPSPATPAPASPPPASQVPGEQKAMPSLPKDSQSTGQ